MNLQKIVDPIADLMVWSFETLLVPFADFVNVSVVILGFVGLAYWLKLQNDYTKKAKREGGII
jgi:hypothetical protein